MDFRITATRDFVKEENFCKVNLRSISTNRVIYNNSDFGREITGKSIDNETSFENSNTQGNTIPTPKESQFFY